MKNKLLKPASFLLYFLSNDEKISWLSRRDYFGLSFFFESTTYVDITSAFKGGNKVKRNRPDD